MDVKEFSYQLRTLIIQIDNQIQEIIDLAVEMGCQPQQVRTSTGEFMLAPLLAAKANLLASLEHVSRRPRSDFGRSY